MADTEMKFSELTAAAVLTDADILAISQIDSATASLMSKRTTLIAIANKLASLTNYTSELATQDKTLTGAINELKGLISLIPHFSIEVVQTLPIQDISETTIYLTPSQNPQTQDAYDEFIYVNNAWEHVGSTAVDLSAYYTKLEVDGLLATKANTADVSAALALKENTADMEDDVTDIVVDLTDTQETAEGNPVILQTVQEGYAKAVTIKLTPKQDLHGYDKPWPGGAGKNKLDPTTIEQGGTDVDGNLVNSIIRVRSGYNKVTAEYQFSVSVNDGILVDTINYYTSAKSFISRSVIGQRTVTVTTPANTEYMLITFKKQGDAQINPSEITQAQYEAGSTATAYEPYANICPIEGYEEASATRSGINIFDEVFEIGEINATTGLNQNNNSLLRTKNYIPISPETLYFPRVGDGTDTTSRLRSRFYGLDKSYLGTDAYGGASVQYNSAFKAPTGAYFMRFTLQAAYGTTYKDDVSINYPATDTDYHAYDGATATAEFPETIYGAEGDAAGGEWEKEYGIVDLGSLNYSYGQSSGVNFFASTISGKKNGNNMICEGLATSTATGVYDLANNSIMGHPTSGRTDIYIRADSYTDPTTFKAAMSGVELAYELATPVPFQTAPAPLTLRKGDNTITTDGDSVKVKYNKLALPDIGGIGRYISALEARVAALEGNGNRSLSLMKSAPIESKEAETKEEETTEAEAETEEEAKNENTSEIK